MALDQSFSCDAPYQRVSLEVSLIVCAEAHAGPLNRRRSRNPYHSASRTVTAPIDFPARILSGRLRIMLRKMTQRTATQLIAALYRPKCHGPRSISPAPPLARNER